MMAITWYATDKTGRREKIQACFWAEAATTFARKHYGPRAKVRLLCQTLVRGPNAAGGGQLFDVIVGGRVMPHPVHVY